MTSAGAATHEAGSGGRLGRGQRLLADQNPCAQSRSPMGMDGPRLIDELAPGIAAVVDDTVARTARKWHSNSPPSLGTWPPSAARGSLGTYLNGGGNWRGGGSPASASLPSAVVATGKSVTHLGPTNVLLS